MTIDDPIFWIIINTSGKNEYYLKRIWRKVDAENHSKSKVIKSKQVNDVSSGIFNNGNNQ